MGNDHGRPKDIAGETRQAFTSPADTAFDVCFENQLTSRSKSDRPILGEILPDSSALHSRQHTNPPGNTWLSNEYPQAAL